MFLFSFVLWVFLLIYIHGSISAHICLLGFFSFLLDRAKSIMKLLWCFCCMHEGLRDLFVAWWGFQLGPFYSLFSFSAALRFCCRACVCIHILICRACYSIIGILFSVLMAMTLILVYFTLYFMFKTLFLIACYILKFRSFVDCMCSKPSRAAESF